MNRIVFTIICLYTCNVLNGQNIANQLFEYHPAPGQYINVENIGTPEAAENMATSIDNVVSLGAFGGMIVFGFEYPCENDSLNPYGIDFTVFGNAFEGSSEPGIIYVMKDENMNGQPDDTWYEIYGSNHFHPFTNSEYEIKYYNPYGNEDVVWVDNIGQTGNVNVNSYHEQLYYPEPDIFSDYPQDSVQFQGTHIEPATSKDNTENIKLNALAFGYADNRSWIQEVDVSLPDNPYTLDVQEGAGGDPVDISWAVDQSGNYVDLDEIHFVKIVTGCLGNLFWLGEISTEVSMIVDVSPNTTVTGQEQVLVIYHHQEKLIQGDSLQLFVQFFENGKPVHDSLVFELSGSDLATIDQNGMIRAIYGGNIDISAYPFGKKEFIQTTSLFIQETANISLLTDVSSFYPDDTIELMAEITNQEGGIIENPKVSYETVGEEIIRIVYIEGTPYLLAIQQGTDTLKVISNGVSEAFFIKVREPGSKMNIYVTINGDNENIFPLQAIELSPKNLNGFIEERNGDYSEFSRPSLAHALAEALYHAGASFLLRDDEKTQGKLYLYEVENDGLYSYGWGGYTDQQVYAKTWIARLNNASYLNGFDQIKMNENDTVVLYHVSDLLNPWELSLLYAKPDSVLSGDEVILSLNKTTCNFENNIIDETEWVPVVNKQVEIGSGYVYDTDANGHVFVVINNPPVVATSGNNAVLIRQKLITTSAKEIVQNIQIYPNPVQDLIRFSGLNPDYANIILLNMNGQIVFSVDNHSLSAPLYVKNLVPGIYLIKIISGEVIYTSKIIKR